MEKNMTGRERLLNVLEGKPVDRVPVSPFIFYNSIYEYYRIDKAFNPAKKEEGVDLVDLGIKLYEEFGFDIILRTCTVWEYRNPAIYDCNNWKVEETREYTGSDSWKITHTVKTPEKLLKQVKGYQKTSPHEIVEAILEYFIKDESDFEQFEKYQPPFPQLDCSNVSRAREMLGDKGLAAPWAQGAFNSVSHFRKTEDLLIDAFMNPDFYNRMMTFFPSRMLDFIKQLAGAGADIICCGGNVANGLVAGPNFFEEHVLSYEREFTKKIQTMGAKQLYHNCGIASNLLELYSEIGMDIFETLAAPPQGDVLLEDAFSKISPKTILSGNIDQVKFLMEATPYQVRERVKEVLAFTKDKGRFILAASDYFLEGTPYENIRAMADAVMEFGVYS
jgi:uroporphyrinogen decarboxylase